jgi:DNA polymerase/3'-5' exonuclease PolX
MSTNSELAERFREIADLLDLAGEKFKPEAYRRAARTIESLTEDVRAVSGRGELDSLPGVGDAISEKIREHLATGSIEYYERIRRGSPPGILEIMRLPGIGPKTARRFWMEVGVEGPAELLAAIDAGRLASLKGFGPRKIELIRKALQPASAPAARTPLRTAARVAEAIVAVLRQTQAVDQIEIAGSLRRGRESVGDIDILVTSTEAERVFDAFSALPERRETVLRGPTKETILVEHGLQVDLRVVEPAAFGAALQYFTGSKDHNVRLRSLARDRGLRINEYGVYRGEERIGGTTEAEVYATLGLALVPPEIREDQGEIAAAAAGTLPNLVAPSDLRGDLHLHVEATESDERIGARIELAKARGWEYLGVIISPPSAVASDRWRARSSGGVTVLVGRELTSWASSSEGNASERPDYWILKADEAGPPPNRAIRPGPVLPLLVGHLTTGAEAAPSDPALASPWIDWAVDSQVALEVSEVGAGGGLDANLVHRLMERGGRVHISSGADDAVALALALRTARRGWSIPDRVLNASSLASLRPAGRPARPVRR